MVTENGCRRQCVLQFGQRAHNLQFFIAKITNEKSTIGLQSNKRSIVVIIVCLAEDESVDVYAVAL